MRATLQLSGAQSGTVVASTTPGTYPAAEVPGAPNPNPNRLGKFVATGSYTVTKAGTTTATLKLLKVDNQTEFNVDTYCAAGITGDIKAAGGALSPTIRQANINGPKPVVKDVTKPVVSIKALNSKAKKVKKVTGTISDAQSGPKSVTVSLIQKRGKKTFAYNGKKWVSGPTLKKANTKAKKITVASSGAWSVTVKKVKKGKITVTYFGTDKAGNVSAPKKYSKALK
jgi:hypothetical protein